MGHDREKTYWDQVLHTSAFLRCPPVLAVAVAGWLHRHKGAGRVEPKFLRALAAIEWLEGLPTRYVTGHYGVKKCELGQPTRPCP